MCAKSWYIFLATMLFGIFGVAYLVHESGWREAKLQALHAKKLECLSRGGYMAMYSQYDGDCLHSTWKRSK